ncbi:hypothetical protein PMAYCL1PPCAC_10465, partial [Pristionchus mayeri]
KVRHSFDQIVRQMGIACCTHNLTRGNDFRAFGIQIPNISRGFTARLNAALAKVALSYTNERGRYDPPMQPYITKTTLSASSSLKLAFFEFIFKLAGYAYVCCVVVLVIEILWEVWIVPFVKTTYGKACRGLKNCGAGRTANQ